ncbi:MAG TPA: hypothetical protein PKE47_15430, partial [Verrucomicrobiota bacterium]|nr:hypothetical protein [Verrucomicrobiota bacterium]
EEIKATFRRNQLVRGAGENDPVSRVVGQLVAFQTGLEAIGRTLQAGLEREPAPVRVDLAPVERSLEALRVAVAEQLRPAAAPAADGGSLAERLGEGLRGLRDDLSRAITAVHSGTMADAMKRMEHELEMVHSTLATLKDIAARQRDHVRSVEELLVARAKEGTVELQLTQEMLENERAFLEKFQQAIAGAQKSAPSPPRTGDSE